MKFLYAGIFVFLGGAALVAAQESFPRPTVTSPAGYSCGLNAKVSPLSSGVFTFSGTCVRILPQGASGAPMPSLLAMPRHYLNALRFPIYSNGSQSDDAAIIQRQMICNGKMAINLAMQCPSPVSREMRQLQLTCIEENYKDSCGLTNIRAGKDCCNPTSVLQSS